MELKLSGGDILRDWDREGEAEVEDEYELEESLLFFIKTYTSSKHSSRPGSCPAGAVSTA